MLLLTGKKADGDFSFMRVDILLVYFRSESEFQSSYCLQHTTMVLAYGSDL